MDEIPVLTRDLLETGFSHTEVGRMARSGELVRLWRGAHARSLETDEAVRHRQLVVATLPLVAPDAVVSHRSAAVLHGLPTFGNLERVQLTRATGSGKRRGYVHLHVAPLPPDEVDDLAGVRVTSGARTVVDLARHQSFPEAVAIGDAALRRQVPRVTVTLRPSRAVAPAAAGAAAGNRRRSAPQPGAEAVVAEPVRKDSVPSSMLSPRLAKAKARARAR